MVLNSDRLVVLPNCLTRCIDGLQNDMVNNLSMVLKNYLFYRIYSVENQFLVLNEF